MLAEMPAHVWAGWQIYMQAEPLGPWAEEDRAARQLALLFNIYRGKARPLTADDFRAGVEPMRMDGEAMRQTMLTWAMTHNARERNGEKL